MLREEPPLQRRPVGQFFVDKAVVFADSMGIRIFKVFACNPAPNGPQQVANDHAAKNIFREAQTFADLMALAVSESAVEGGQTDSRMAAFACGVLLSRVNAPDYRPVRMATLAEFAERWKETVLSQRKPSSQKAALSNLRHHILPQLGNVRLDALGKEAQAEQPASVIEQGCSVRLIPRAGRAEISTLRTSCVPAHARKFALAHRSHAESCAGAVAARRSARHAWNVLARDRRRSSERCGTCSGVVVPNCPRQLRQNCAKMRPNQEGKRSGFNKLVGAGDGNRIVSPIHKPCVLMALPPPSVSNGAKWSQIRIFCCEPLVAFGAGRP